MQIEYTVRPEDLMASREYYTQSSEVMRKSSRTETFGTASTIIAFFAFLTILINTYVPIMLGVIIALVWVFVWPSMQKNSYHRRQVALYAESRNVISLGRKVMDLEDDILAERSELHWSKTKLPAIERIVISEKHAFFFYGTFLGFVIPRETVQKGDFDTFVSTVQERFNSLMETSAGE